MHAFWYRNTTVAPSGFSPCLSRDSSRVTSCGLLGLGTTTASRSHSGQPCLFKSVTNASFTFMHLNSWLHSLKTWNVRPGSAWLAVSNNALTDVFCRVDRMKLTCLHFDTKLHSVARYNLTTILYNFLGHFLQNMK